jgi:hypothetical protein
VFLAPSVVMACGPSFETRCSRTAPQDEVFLFVDKRTNLILRSPAQQGVSKDGPCARSIR